MGGPAAGLRARRARVTDSRLASPLAWACVLPFAAWALTRTLGLESGFPGVALIALTPYLAALAPVAVLWALLLDRRWAALAATASAVALIAAVVPRTVAGTESAVDGPSLRTMSINLLAGSADIDQVARVAEEADVQLLSVQELTPEAAEEIAASRLAERLPFSRIEAGPGSRGIGLYSSHPFLGAGEAGLGPPQPGLQARLRRPGGGLLVPVAIHPPPPSSPGGIRALVDYLEAIGPADAGGPPRILIGDFNSTLDNDALRAVLDRGYADAADQRGAGLKPTWPAGIWPPPVTIDHVIYDRRLEALSYDVVRIDGTDHRAVLAELSLPGATGAEPG